MSPAFPELVSFPPSAFHPLLSAWRAQTAIERFLGANQREAMVGLIADPANLHRLVTMRVARDRTRAEHIRGLIAYGAAAYYGSGLGTLPDG